MDRSNDNLKDLELLIRSHYSIIFVETPEEERAETLLKLLAGRLGIPYFHWSRTKGLSRGDIESKGPVYGTADLSQALKHIEASGFQAIYHLKDAGDLLEDRTASRMLKDAAAPYTKNHGAIVITGHSVRIPESIRQSSAFFKLNGPGRDEHRKLLGRVASDLYARMKAEIKLSDEDTNRLLNNLRGLTLTEAEKIITRLIVEDGELDAGDIERVIDAKKEIVEREGVLEYYPAEEGMSEIADLRTLKSWLSKRKEIFTDPEKALKFGLSFPKGVLLLGVPGCGKSLSAKAVAKEWGLPLLKMDPSSLYNKYIGESEKNFRRAMDTAEKMSPVVLWIDEIEKAFSAGGEAEDGGVSARIFGTFLSWLQERKGDVFIVATANDVEKLPPEFLRKGRFDEIFFIDLPDEETRRSIFEIHLKKRGKDVSRFDLPALVRMTEGFSGAEIEQVIVSGLYTSYSAKKELDTDTLAHEITATRPLSEVMAEKISSLRDWAAERTVSAH
jgi:hypothetical protein